MSDYIEWDGTEQRLEELLIWWGTCIPWEHSPDCKGDSLHCCVGVSEFNSPNTIECSTPPWDLSNLTFGDEKGAKSLIEIGDRIYYRGQGLFELVKK